LLKRAVGFQIDVVLVFHSESSAFNDKQGTLVHIYLRHSLAVSFILLAWCDPFGDKLAHSS